TLPSRLLLRLFASMPRMPVISAFGMRGVRMCSSWVRWGLEHEDTGRDPVVTGRVTISSGRAGAVATPSWPCPPYVTWRQSLWERASALALRGVAAQLLHPGVEPGANHRPHGGWRLAPDQSSRSAESSLALRSSLPAERSTSASGLEALAPCSAAASDATCPFPYPLHRQPTTRDLNGVGPELGPKRAPPDPHERPTAHARRDGLGATCESMMIPSFYR